VSSGLGQATASGGSSGGQSWRPNDGGEYFHDHYHPRHEPAPTVLVVGGGGGALPPSSPQQPRTVSVDFFAGAQKVHESDGSLSLELAFNEGRFRLGGSLTKYYERQEGAEALTLTLPALYLGVRVTGGGPTRAYVELGGVGVETAQDPVMDSSVAGILGGVRVEHKTSRRTAVVWDAQAMVFEEGVRAGAARAGFRVGPLQASLRYLDFNTGPALFGPEVGLRF
jgi:hypothetical protein